MNSVLRPAPEPAPSQVVSGEWVTFPGGELEGKRPRVLCLACRDAVGRAAVGRVPWTRHTLCFQCYRAEIARERALKGAGELDTASAERFQTTLPFEPVNRPRLEMLKAERSTARGALLATASGTFADRRRRAQMAARHALQRIAATLSARKASPADHARVMAAAIHAAELQLPESWLPFVVSR